MLMIPYSNSKITLELRELLKMTDENGKPFTLFDFDYPSYYKGDEKLAFEQKVIDHYLFRQIGFETPARFKHQFKTRLREIMPYYLDMYKTVEIMHGIEDPFGNVDVTETYEEERTGTTTGSQTASSTGSQSASSTESATGTQTASATRSSTGSSSSESSSSSSSDGEDTTSSTTTHTNTENTTTETSSGLEKTDTKTASEDLAKKFSDTPQNNIGNINSYMTEATVEDNQRDETVTINETATTDGSETKTTTGNDTVEATSTSSVDTSTEASSTTSDTTSGEEESETTSTGESSSSSSSESSSESNASNSASNNETIKHTLTRKGNQGVNTYAHDMIEFRKSIINVDLMVINELSDLFLRVY